MTVLHTEARAKINLCLFVGPRRGDGRHEVVTLMDSLSLCDDVRMDTDAPGLVADEVLCPGVTGPNLAADALRAFRQVTGWDGAPVRVEIDKRIPVAGGMAGGSADAAAVLRLAHEASGLGDRRLLEVIGATFGSDVASQVRGGLVLATGEGSRLRPLNLSLPYSVVVQPVDAELPTAEVYLEADRLGLPRETLDLARALTRLQASLSAETILDHLHNDLQDAARSLCPAIDEAIEAVLAGGADHGLVSGSGPTVLGVFVGSGHAERARRVCESIHAEGRTPAPVLAQPAGPMSFG
jgi:4-diphosphocytidyl-2-C-methyl-D-erythritol kinase